MGLSVLKLRKPKANQDESVILWTVRGKWINGAVGEVRKRSAVLMVFQVREDGGVNERFTQEMWWSGCL